MMSSSRTSNSGLSSAGAWLRRRAQARTAPLDTNELTGEWSLRLDGGRDFRRTRVAKLSDKAGWRLHAVRQRHPDRSRLAPKRLPDAGRGEFAPTIVSPGARDESERSNRRGQPANSPPHLIGPR